MAYTTTDLVADALGLDSSDTSRDAAIAAAVAAAEKMIDKHCGRTFNLDSTATARTYPGPCDGELVTDDIGSTTGLVVETGYRGSLTWTATTDYEVYPLNALAKGQAITGISAAGSLGGIQARVRVTAKWGWPSVPDEVKQAALLTAIRLFKRKDSPEGVLGSNEFGTVRVSRLDPDVQALLAHYVLPGF